MAALRPSLALALLLLPAAGPPPPSGPPGRPDRGEAFAEAHCARCHAIGRTGSSPQAEALPFRELHRRYPVEDLAEAFAEGITTGHPEMPAFELDPDQIKDLIAYLRSLEGR